MHHNPYNRLTEIQLRAAINVAAATYNREAIDSFAATGEGESSLSPIQTKQAPYNMASRSCFYVVVSGAVETCEITGGDNLFCQFSYNYGKDWGVVHGTESGLSQIAKRSNNAVTWNYPLEVTFKSTNVHGWPQIVVLVCGYNFWNQQVVRGYGCVHIPPTPGRHIRYLPLYTPLSSSWFMQCINWMTGNHAEFMEHNFVAKPNGREVTRVRSNGHVKIVINVMTKNMNDFGYSVDSERWQDESGSSQAIKLLARAPLPTKADTKLDQKHTLAAEVKQPSMIEEEDEPAATPQPTVSAIKRPAQPAKQQPMDFDTELRPTAGGGSGTAASTAAPRGGAGAGKGSAAATGSGSGSARGGGDIDYDSKYPPIKASSGSGSARGSTASRVPARTAPVIDNESDDAPVTASGGGGVSASSGTTPSAAPTPSSGGLAPIKKRSFAPLSDSGSATAGSGAGGGGLPPKKRLEPLGAAGGGAQTPVRVNRPPKSRPAPAPAASDDADDALPDDAPRPRDDSGDTGEHTPLRAKKQT